MWLTILPGAGQSPHTGVLAPNVSGAETEKGSDISAFLKPAPPLPHHHHTKKMEESI